MNRDLPFAGTSLCVVGNINRDIKTAPLPADVRLFADGETSVASIAETIGGGGANSAFAAAALGARVAFAGKIGADALGDRLERTLRAHGIAPHLARDAAEPTGTSLALAFENGHRHFLSHLPTNASMTFADLDLRALAGHTHLLRADIWFSEAMLFEGNRRLFTAARAAGMQTSIDLNWDPQWGRAEAAQIQARKQAVRDVLPLVDFAHGNERELREFADAPDLASALQCITAWGAGAVVVHLGDRGAGFYCDGRFITEPPAPIERQLHTTGTGDVLSICTMLLLQQAELSMPARLKLANAIVAEFMEGRRALIPPLSA